MPNPIEVERAFQHTLSEIGSAPSYRLVYHLFWEFTESLDGKYETYDSYLLQLMDELPRFSNPLTWSGIGPGLLQKYGHRLETIQKRLQTESADETIRRLHEVTFFQFVCLNDTDGAKTIYKKLFGSGFPQDMEKNFSTSVQDNFRLIVSKFEAGPELFKDKKQKKSAQSLIQDFRFVLHQEKQRALVPVVEKYGNRKREAYQTGRLRMLTVMIDQQGTDADRLARRFNVYGAETASYIEKESIAGAARELAKKTDVYLADTFCKGSVEYTVNSISHDGDSANAAISILWFTALLSTSGGRIRYSLKPNVVITGDINKAGNILPIDKKSIEWKAKAAFFSWADVLAVPASQRKKFENAIRELEEQYPTRKLSLIGIGNLEEMLFDRRISNHDVISKTRHVARQLKREKFKTVSIPTILILLLIIARLIYGPVDRNVVDIDVSEGQLLLKNDVGSTVKAITLDKSTSDYLNVRRNFSLYSLTLLNDINQDGNNELIYATRDNYGVNDSPNVMAWSISGDSLIWKTELTFNYSYPRQSMNDETRLRVYEIGLMNTPSGEKIIVNARSRMYFYSIIFALDLENGDIEKEYVHPGSIMDINIANLNNKEHDTLLMAGINNAYWMAMLSVAEYDEIAGYAPAATIDYIPEGIEESSQKKYLLFPKSVIGKYFNPVYKYNIADQIIFNDSADIIQVILKEGTTRFSNLEEDIKLIFELDVNFGPAGIGTYDIYDIYARDLHQQGEIPFEPDYDYFEALQDSILYWNGVGFVPTQEYFSE